MKKVSILIPCYNEEETLPYMFKVLQDVMHKGANYDWELIFVNDGSKDGTLDYLRDLRSKDKRVNYIDLSRNFGKENAMLAGFDFATGDCLAILDADLQDPPEIILDMLKYWEEGYEDIYAKRVSRGKESWLRRQASLAFYKLLQKTSKFDILENVGDFRLLDRKCIDALKQLRESKRYTKGMFCWIGFQKKEILFDRQDRIAGKSAWNGLQLFNLAIEGITSFTVAPLKISIWIGVIISFFSFIYMLYIACKTLIWGEPIQGFPSLMVVITFLGGIELLCLGIIGEYLGKIFIETKKRPVYFIREVNGKKN